MRFLKAYSASADETFRQKFFFRTSARNCTKIWTEGTEIKNANRQTTTTSCIFVFYTSRSVRKRADYGLDDQVLFPEGLKISLFATMYSQTLWPTQSIRGTDIGQTDSLFKASI